MNTGVRESKNQGDYATIKATPFTPVIMTTIKKKRDNKSWWSREKKGTPRAQLVGMEIGVAAMENGVKFPQQS